MRNYYATLSAIIIISTAASQGFAAPVNVEIHSALLWSITDDLNRRESFVHYAPAVCRQGAPCSLDFATHDSFANPVTGKREKFFDGVIARFTITLSQDEAVFKGVIEYQTHLGITAAYDERDQALRGQTVRRYTNYLSGRVKFDEEIRIQVGEDINNGIFLVLRFSPTHETAFKFKNEIESTDEQLQPLTSK